MRRATLREGAAPARTEEMETVRRCLRAWAGGVERAARAQEPRTEGLDVTRLLAAAERHRVVPLVARELAAIAPPGLREPLRRRALGQAVRTNRLTAELLRLLDVFAAEGMRVLPFKGPVLAAQAYGDASLRFFDDLDLLVPPLDAERAYRALLGQQYRPELVLRPCERRACTRAGTDLVLRHPSGEFTVELTHPAGPHCFARPYPAETLWETAESVVVDGRPVTAPGAAPLIVLLALHGTRHLWCRLSFLCDIAGLLRRCKPDAGQVMEWARRLGAQRRVRLALGLVREVLGVAPPAPFEPWMERDRQAARLAEWSGGWLLAESPEVPRGLAEVRYHLAAQDGAAGRLRYLARLALTPSYSDWRAVRLPAPLFPLYYGVRPFRLARDAARRVR